MALDLRYTGTDFVRLGYIAEGDFGEKNLTADWVRRRKRDVETNPRQVREA